MPIVDRLRKVWNAFRAAPVAPQSIEYSTNVSYGSSPPSSRHRGISYSERSIVSSIYTRLAIDVASVDFRHVRTDDDGRYKEDIDSFLNICLTHEPNLDQGPRAFKQDIAMTLFDRGVCAIVPVDANVDPQTNAIFDVVTMRVGEVLVWYPKHVRLSVYNEKTGKREEITLEKRFVSIIENPLFSVMNEPNSTLQRLIRKLTLLDAVDEQSSSGKLDLIIQLPYTIKSEAKKEQAEKRRADIELQLRGSQYGIAYVDGTEKVTQLNRPAENNLLAQVEYLTKLLYNQLGLTEEVMNGTADEKAMINYFARTIKPIVESIAEAMQRTLLGLQATMQKERIAFFRDPFELVPVSEIAEIADKFARNEIVTSNEIRSAIGMRPSSDPKADELMNSNMPQPVGPVQNPGSVDSERNSQNGS